MPMIECTLIEGYEKDIRKLLAERVTDAASSTIGAHPDQVIVTIKEVHATNYMRGRVTRTPAAAPKQPDILVREYLSAMEQRDLELAKQYLDKDFTMVFPGGVKFKKLEELILWSGKRYKFAKKSFESFDTSFNGLEATVFCSGYLEGTWLNGEAFSEIRFIDRFIVSNMKIKFQSVWNDMAESLR